MKKNKPLVVFTETSDGVKYHYLTAEIMALRLF
jgi:hypothetical protein